MNDDPLPILPPMIAELLDVLPDEEESKQDSAVSGASESPSKDTDEPPGIPVVVFVVTLVLGGILASLLVDNGIGIQVVRLATTEPVARSVNDLTDDLASLLGTGPLVVYHDNTQPALLPTSVVLTFTPVPTPTVQPTSIPPLPTLVSTPSPYGDENGNPAPAPELYPWADWDWRDYASHIVAGEANDTEVGRRVVACTLVRDVLLGWAPRTLTTRWYGWKEPEWEDRLAVWEALQVEGCRDIPWYQYVGTRGDYDTWVSKGIVSVDDSYDVYGDMVAVE